MSLKIVSRPSNKNYVDNWDRIFGGENNSSKDILIDQESFNDLVNRVKNPKEPTLYLKQLMKDTTFKSIHNGKDCGCPNKVVCEDAEEADLKAFKKQSKKNKK